MQIEVGESGNADQFTVGNSDQEKKNYHNSETLDWENKALADWSDMMSGLIDISRRYVTEKWTSRSFQKAIFCAASALTA